jgi:hypothetical protein
MDYPPDDGGCGCKLYALSGEGNKPLWQRLDRQTRQRDRYDHPKLVHRAISSFVKTLGLMVDFNRRLTDPLG